MNNTSKAVLLMFLSAIAFTIMGIMVRLSGDLPTFEKVLFRNLISLIVAFFTIRKTKAKIIGDKKNLKFLILRSFLGLCGVMLFFYAIDNIYLADAAMLNKISPFFVTLFAFFFLKEKINKIQIPGLILVFSASMLVIKPKFDLSILPSLAGFLSAAAAGGAYTVVRYLSGKESPATIIFFFSLVSTLGVLPLSLIDFIMPDQMQWITLLLTGVFAAFGQFALTNAYRFAPANQVSVFSYAHIILSALAGYFIWNEVLDIYSIIGGTIVITVSVIMYFYNR